MIYRVSAGHCEACDKVLDETEMRITGYNSGVELGLCRHCASFVNDPVEIDRQERSKESGNSDYYVHEEKESFTTEDEDEIKRAILEYLHSLD